MASHYYIYDHRLRDKRFGKILTKIESRLQKLGLEGERERLHHLSKPREVIKKTTTDSMAPETLVLVGGDDLFMDAVNVVCETEREIVIGFIPMFRESNITRNLGLGIKEKAAETLAGRMVRKMDVGYVGAEFFFDTVSIEGHQLACIVNKNFTILPRPNVDITCIQNLKQTSLPRHQQESISPQDGLLDVVFYANQRKNLFWGSGKRADSVVKATSIKIKSLKHEEVAANLDGQYKLKTPMSIGQK